MVNRKNQKKILLFLLFVVILVSAALTAINIIRVSKINTKTEFATEEEYVEAINNTSDAKIKAKVQLNYAKLTMKNMNYDEALPVLKAVDVKNLAPEDVIELYAVFRDYYYIHYDDAKYTFYNELISDITRKYIVGEGDDEPKEE